MLKEMHEYKIKLLPPHYLHAHPEQHQNKIHASPHMQLSPPSTYRIAMNNQYRSCQRILTLDQCYSGISDSVIHELSASELTSCLITYNIN